ncbi:phospholipase-like protein, partial [Tanacetum coccineum]
VLAHERNDKLERLQFNEDFSRMSSDFRESLNIVFQDLIDPHDSDEDIANDYLVEEELRLCLEEEERTRLEQQKIIEQEKSFRIEEAKRMRLEEEKMLQIAEVNKKKRLEFMNSTHMKNSLAKMFHDFFHSMDIVWLTDDIEQFLGQLGQLKCKFPWSDDYTVDRNLWLRLVCLEPARKGWLSEDHIDLWVDYMWHGRPENANWAMVSCYFVQILLQNNMPLFYANGDKYATQWSDVDQVFIPINETDQHWCLARLDIMSGLITFYDSGDTYDYE